jgi:hypothetical protein
MAVLQITLSWVASRDHNAIGIAASRALLGMHFLSDVLAGAALGASLGAIATAMIR